MTEQTYWTGRLQQRLNRRRALAGGGSIGFALAAAGLVGCSSSTNNSKPTAAATTRAPVAPAGKAALSGTAAGGGAPSASAAARPSASPAAAQPKRGGAIVLAASTGEQAHHDVDMYSSGLLHLRGSGIAYSRLIRRKLGPDVVATDIIPQGDIAASWQQPDELTYVFKLQPNVKWHNIAPVNGRLLTADDVIYSIKRQLDLKISAAYIPAGIDKFDAPDAGTVRMTVKKPDADFMTALTAGQNKIIAHEAVDLKGDLKDGPVIGTGAWIFKDWIPNSTMRFTRNPDYWRKDQFGTQYPYGDTLELLRIADYSTALAAFRTQQIIVDGPTGGDPTLVDADSLKKSNPALQTRREVESPNGFAVTMRADIAPTNDLRWRQAVSKAIDRQAVISTVLSGAGLLNVSLISTNTSDQLLPEEETKKLLARDLTAAKQLAQQAGLNNWSPAMWVYTLQGPNQPAAELIQAQLKDIGVSATIQTMDNTKLNSWYSQHDLPFIAAPPAAFVFGPNAYLNQVVRTGGGRNVSNISDAQLDGLIDAQAAELKDANHRKDLLYQAQRRILELAAMTPVFCPQADTLAWPYVRNIYAGRTQEPGYYEEVWLDK